MPSDGAVHLPAASALVTRGKSVHFDTPTTPTPTHGDEHAKQHDFKAQAVPAAKHAFVVPSPMLLLTLPSLSSSSLLPSVTPRTAQLPASKLAAHLVPSAKARVDRYHYGNIKPTFRGVLHELLTYVTLPFSAYMLHLSYPWPRLMLSSAVYCACLFLSLLSSALYHRVHWSTPWREELLRKIDHLSIFLVGAGGGTPFALLLLLPAQPAAAYTLLALLWLIPCVAAARLWTRLCTELTSFDLALHLLHLALSAPFLVLAFRQLPPFIVGCVLAVWALYAIAYVLFIKQWPVGWPLLFGYHEVFHVVVSAAFLLSMYTHIEIVKGKQAGLF